MDTPLVHDDRLHSLYIKTDGSESEIFTIYKLQPTAGDLIFLDNIGSGNFIKCVNRGMVYFSVSSLGVVTIASDAAIGGIITTYGLNAVFYENEIVSYENELVFA